MKKKLLRIALGLFVLGLIAGLVKTALPYINVEQIKTVFTQKTSPALPPKQVKVPDIRELVAQQGSVAAPTDAQLKEEKEINDQQVATAGQWLASKNAQERHNGAEQLSAYPTPAAEIMLANSLKADPDATVRSAAAESLAAFESLNKASIAVLLSAMNDTDENVQLNALSTLQKQAFDEEQNPSKSYKIILHGLKKQLKSARLNEDMRNAVQGFIEDQQSE